MRGRSRFDDDSDVGRVNRRPGEWVRVARETWEVLCLAEQAHRQTGGLFHPGLGGRMAELGYDRPWPAVRGKEECARPDVPAGGAMAQVGTRAAHPSQWARTGRATSAGNPPHLLSDPGLRLRPGGFVRLEPGFRLDLGGIAKGWIVEQAARHLQAHGYTDFVCNAGGDLICAGRRGDRPWVVGVADPADPARDVFTLAVESACVATSGTYKRRWTLAGQARHHLVDPRTGRPADSGVASCTVIAPRLVWAEVMAKVCLILGLPDGLEWLRHQPQQGWVVVTETGEVHHAWNL